VRQREASLKASSAAVADVHGARRAPGGIAQSVAPLLIVGSDVVEPMVSLREDLGQPDHANLIQAETHPVAMGGNIPSNKGWRPIRSDCARNRGLSLTCCVVRVRGWVMSLTLCRWSPVYDLTRRVNRGANHCLMPDGYVSRDRDLTIIFETAPNLSEPSVTIERSKFWANIVRCICYRLQGRFRLDLKFHYMDQSWDVSRILARIS
jgi:hypothetical protein